MPLTEEFILFLLYEKIAPNLDPLDNMVLQTFQSIFVKPMKTAEMGGVGAYFPVLICWQRFLFNSCTELESFPTLFRGQ